MILHTEASLNLPSSSVNVSQYSCRANVALESTKVVFHNKIGKAKDLIAMHISKAICISVSCKKLSKYFRIKGKIKNHFYIWQEMRRT